MAALYGVEAKLARARDHYKTIHASTFLFQQTETHSFRVEVHGKGHKHVYRAVDPKPIPEHWPAVFGDCVHNLRSALDHLAW